MTVLEAIILGLVQGLSEFLPISSSGHLVLAERLLGVEGDNLRFIVVVHLGTLLAVLAVYRRVLLRLLRGLGSFHSPEVRLILLLAAATVPAVLFSYFARSWIQESLARTWEVGLFLILTGAVLYGLRFRRDRGGRPNLPRALAVGLAQALAIFPGISRSGLTISAGIYSGMERTRAADFSFLLSIPIILGAGLYELWGVAGEGISSAEVGVLVAGGVTAALSGYLAIRFLLGVIKRRRLHYFAYYCWLAGLAVLALT